VTAEQNTFEIRTRRLRGGPLGAALAVEDGTAQSLVEALINHLDGGEGWVSRESPTVSWWYPSRLGARVWTHDDERPLVEVDVTVAVQAALTDELLELLNDLNAHAAGYWWWWHEGMVRCSVRCEASQRDWWWPLSLFDVIPGMVTTAESMADTVARVSGGVVADSPHPERGLRPTPDGWISGTRLGPREPCASLGLPLLPREYHRTREALKSMTSPEAVLEVEPTGFAVVHENDTLLLWRDHWHAQNGWGWQFSTATGLVAGPTGAGRNALLLLAAELNTEQALNPVSANAFGGWCYVHDAGLVHTTFVPAPPAEKIAASAGPTVGDVIALMAEVVVRASAHWQILERDRPPGCEAVVLAPQDVSNALARSVFTTGAMGYSYIDHGGLAPTSKSDNEPLFTDLAQLPFWTVPRHQIVCSMGIFNPAGPTVSSLEIGWSSGAEGVKYSLYDVLRHPFLPRIELLGQTDDLEEMTVLITKCLSETDQGVLGGGNDWLTIHWAPEAVIAGVTAYGRNQTDTDLGAAADLLHEYALFPWARLENRADAKPKGDDALADPVGDWVAAITDPIVTLGHRLLLRSAWEGAKAHRDSGWVPEAAQAASDFARRLAEERLSAE